jgi:beta-mannosidase
VLASFKALADGTVELWITNDTLAEVSDTVEIEGGTFAGGRLWQEQQQVRIPANSSQMVWRGEAQRIIGGPDHYLVVRSGGQLFPPNRHFFAPIKDLDLSADVQPDVTITPNGQHQLLVHLHAPAYLFYVHLLVPDEHIHFSDNYFDLAPGESRTISVTNPAQALTLEMLTVAWYSNAGKEEATT